MGNRVAVDKDYVELSTVRKMASDRQFLQQIQKSCVSSPKKLLSTFNSNIKIWSIASTANNEIVVKNVLIPEKFGKDGFLSHCCYIVLHLYTLNANNTTGTSATEEQVSTFQGHSLLKLISSSTEQLTPRGLEHTFSISENSTSNTSPFSTFSTFRRNKSFDASDSDIPSIAYDLYLWQGKESSASVQATAVTKSYELERALISEIVANNLAILFCAGNPQPVTNFFVNDVPSLGSSKSSQPNSSSFVSMYQTSHLFRKLTNKNTEMEQLIQAFTKLPDCNYDTTIRSLLQLPRFAFETSLIEKEASNSPRSPQKKPIIPPIVPPKSNSFSTLSSISSSRSSVSSPSAPPTPSSLHKKRSSNSLPTVPRLSAIMNSPRDKKRPNDGPLDSSNDNKKVILTPRTSSSRESDRSSEGDSQRSYFSLNLNSVERTPDQDPSPTPRKRESKFLNGLSKPMSGAELVVHYRKICSQITDYLYLGSDLIARNKEELMRHGITHVVNAAKLACDIYFPDDFEYLALNLYDAGNQAILGSFFEAIDFIESARKKNTKIYVHCYEGVSRSSTIVIAYLMWKERDAYNKVLERVKNKRPVCSPNAGFLVQLMTWQKMLHDPQTYLFRMAPLNDKYHEHKQIVPKMCNSDLIDSRTSFVLYNPKIQTIFICIGEESRDFLKEKAVEFATLFHKYFTFSKAKVVVYREKEALQDSDFVESLKQIEFDKFKPKEFSYTDLNHLTNYSISPSPTTGEEANSKATEDDGEDEDSDMDDEASGELYKWNEDKNKWEEEDLDSDMLFCDQIYVLKPSDDDDTIFVWIGSDLEQREEFGIEKGKQFLAAMNMEPRPDIVVVYQDEESKEFWKYFDN